MPPRIFVARGWMMFCLVFFYLYLLEGDIPQREKPPTFPIMTVSLALLCQPRSFAISVGIWRKSPNKSAGAEEKKV